MTNPGRTFLRIDSTHKITLILALLLVFAPLAQAQTGDCGNGVPCGPLPWRLPLLPNLPSPTPMPTIAVTNVSANPGPGTDTPVPTATTTPYDIDVTAIGDSVATLNAIIAQTPMPIYVDAESTEEVDLEANFTELGINAGSFFGYARGLSDEQFGPLSPLIAFMLLALTIVIAVKMLTYLLPVLAALFGILRKIVNVVLEFIPL